MSLFASIEVPFAYSEDESVISIEVRLLSSPEITNTPPVKFELSSSLIIEPQIVTLDGLYGNRNVFYYIYDAAGILQVVSSGTMCHGEITISEVASLPSGQYSLIIKDGDANYEYFFVIER